MGEVLRFEESSRPGRRRDSGPPEASAVILFFLGVRYERSDNEGPESPGCSVPGGSARGRKPASQCRRSRRGS